MGLVVSTRPRSIRYWSRFRERGWYWGRRLRKKAFLLIDLSPESDGREQLEKYKMYHPYWTVFMLCFWISLSICLYLHYYSFFFSVICPTLSCNRCTTVSLGMNKVLSYLLNWHKCYQSRGKKKKKTAKQHKYSSMQMFFLCFTSSPCAGLWGINRSKNQDQET